VEVRSDRRYRFDVPPPELWAAMTDVGAYRAWWPWLTRFEAGAFAAGEAWRCTVQPPLPYVLRFTLHLDAVDPPREASATVDGDIVGEARVVLHDGGDGGSELHLTSSLAPANGVLRAVARLAGPVVRFGHDWVLDTGVRQFRSKGLPPDR